MSLTLEKLKNEIGELANCLEGTRLADTLRDIKEGVNWSPKELVKPRVFITIEGGLVQAVESDTEIDTIICDFDTDGMDQSGLSEINGNEAYVYDGHVGVDAQTVDELFKQVEKNNA